MRILLTNDDGYQAAGIQSIAAALARRGHVISLCAPLTQRSASSHSITLFKPLPVLRIDGGYAVDGTPADCVKIALHGLFPDVPFDLVLSGINDGPNMGDDVFYSGTVAGAREGAMNGVPSIAFSLDDWSVVRDFSHAASLAVHIAEAAGAACLPRDSILNVNFPKGSTQLGAKATHLGRRIYNDVIIVEGLRGDGKFQATISGEIPSFHPMAGSDLQAVSEGHVSITPLANECTAPSMISAMERMINSMPLNCFSHGMGDG